MPSEIVQEKKFHPDGALFWKGSYCAGKLEGKSEYYYPNGHLSSCSMYKDGKKEGDSLYYDIEGKLIHEAHYCNGLAHGEEKFFDSEGRLATKLVWDKGQLIHVSQFYPDGLLARTIELKQGKRSGIDRMINPDKSVRFEFEYRAGNLIKILQDDTTLSK